MYLTKDEFLQKFGILPQEFEEADISWEELLEIADDYERRRPTLEKIRKEFVAEFLQDKEKEIGLQSYHSRLKDTEHLVEKLVRKRLENYAKYRKMDSTSYMRYVTDLIGIRGLLLYREDWVNFHKYITHWFKNDPEKYIRVQRTRELNGSKEGIIHLAYIYTMGSNFTPKMVRNFLDAYPDYHIDFHFTVGTTGDILAGLKEDKYDIVFSSYQEGEPDIEFRKIGNQKLVVAVPQDHPLAIHGSVDLRDTIAYPQIYFEKGSGLRPVIDQMFAEINQFPKVAFEMEEDSSMAGLVAQGFGIAVMPDIPILKSLNLKTLEISHPVYERSVYLATLKKHYLSPVAKSFIQFVCQQTEGR